MKKRTYELWQLAPSSKNLFKLYNEENEIDIFEYVGVYRDEFDSMYDDKDECEELYDTFNLTTPPHFAGRSMSMSDIVRMYDVVDERTTNEKFYYCDFIGFVDITDKIKKVKKY